MIRKLFGYHKWESVSAVLLGLGRLNFKHLVMLRKVKFYWHLYRSTDVFLRDMGLGTKKFMSILFRFLACALAVGSAVGVRNFGREH